MFSFVTGYLECIIISSQLQNRSILFLISKNENESGESCWKKGE